MAIQNQQGAAMPNPYPHPSAANHNDAVTAINALEYHHLWRGPGTAIRSGTVRIDLQGYTTAGQMNLQVQINGVGAPSTVATVLVAATCQALPPPSQRGGPQQIEIVRVIKSALFNSLHDFEQANPHIWLVSGTPSS